MKKVAEYVSQVMHQVKEVKTVQFEIRVDDEGHVNQHGCHTIRFNYTRPITRNRDTTIEDQISQDLEAINANNREALKGKRR